MLNACFKKYSALQKLINNLRKALSLCSAYTGEGPEGKCLYFSFGSSLVAKNGRYIRESEYVLMQLFATWRMGGSEIIFFEEYQMRTPNGPGWLVLLVFALGGLFILPGLPGGNWFLGLVIGLVVGYIIDLIVPSLHQSST